MKFGINNLNVDFEQEFIKTLDRWKELVLREGIKQRLKKIIEEDKKILEGQK